MSELRGLQLTKGLNSNRLISNHKIFVSKELLVQKSKSWKIMYQSFSGVKPVLWNFFQQVHQEFKERTQAVQ